MTEPIGMEIKILNKSQNENDVYTGVIKIHKRDYAFEYKNKKAKLKGKLPMSWNSNTRWEFKNLVAKYVEKELNKNGLEEINLIPTKHARLKLTPEEKLKVLFDLKIEIQNNEGELKLLQKERVRIIKDIRSIAQKIGDDKRKLIDWI